jgi:hypothetical protein
MKPATILRVYRSLWQNFSNVCRAAGSVAKPSNGATIQIDEAASTDKQTVIGFLICLSNWQYKAASPAERIEILLRSREIYSRDDGRMAKSTVQVMYLELKDQDAFPLLALHYDFELPVKTAHPVFHAQMGQSTFDKAELEQVGFRATIKNRRTRIHSSVRIPTPCMNFSSVLLGLAADHLPPAVFARILTLVRSSDLAHWDADCGALKTSLDARGGYLPSHHWYS